MMTPGEMVATLETKYQEELTAYRELLTVAARVREKLEAGQEDEIEPLLAEQAALTAAVDRLEEVIRPLRRSAGESYRYRDLTLAVVRQEVKKGNPSLRPLSKVMEDVAVTLHDLAEVYAENKQVLEARLSSIRAEQIELGRAKRAAQAYQAPGGGETAPRFLDKRS